MPIRFQSRRSFPDEGGTSTRVGETFSKIFDKFNQSGPPRRWEGKLGPNLLRRRDRSESNRPDERHFQNEEDELGRQEPSDHLKFTNDRSTDFSSNLDCFVHNIQGHYTRIHNSTQEEPMRKIEAAVRSGMIKHYGPAFVSRWGSTDILHDGSIPSRLWLADMQLGALNDDSSRGKRNAVPSSTAALRSFSNASEMIAAGPPGPPAKLPFVMSLLEQSGAHTQGAKYPAVDDPQSTTETKASILWRVAGWVHHRIHSTPVDEAAAVGTENSTRHYAQPGASSLPPGTACSPNETQPDISAPIPFDLSSFGFSGQPPSPVNAGTVEAVRDIMTTVQEQTIEPSSYPLVGPETTVHHYRPPLMTIVPGRTPFDDMDDGRWLTKRNILLGLAASSVITAGTMAYTGQGPPVSFYTDTAASAATKSIDTISSWGPPVVDTFHSAAEWAKPKSVIAASWLADKGREGARLAADVLSGGATALSQYFRERDGSTS